MKNFKKLYALIFVIATIVFGVLVLINEKDVFSAIFQADWGDELERGIAIYAVLVALADIGLIALPVVYLILLLTDKANPFKAIGKAAYAVLCKFLVSIFGLMILLAAWGADWEIWKEYLFGDSLVIIPLLVFIGALVFIAIASGKKMEGTFNRAVLTTIGSGLAIFGLVFYVILGKGGDGIITQGDLGFLQIFGLILGIACFGGLIAYCFLPQTREYTKE